MNPFIICSILVCSILASSGSAHYSWALELGGSSASLGATFPASRVAEDPLPTERRDVPLRTREFQEHVIEMLKRIVELSQVHHPGIREHQKDDQRTISEFFILNHPFHFLKDRIGPWFETSIAACNDYLCLNETEAEISEVLDFWLKLIKPYKKKLDPSKFPKVREALRALDADPKLDENLREGVRTLISVLNGEQSFREWIANTTGYKNLRIKTKNELKALLIRYQHHLYRATLTQQAKIHGLATPAYPVREYSKTLLPCHSVQSNNLLRTSFGIGGVVSLGHFLCKDQAGSLFDVFLSGVGVGGSGTLASPLVKPLIPVVMLLTIWSPFGKFIEPSGIWLGSSSEVAAYMGVRIGVYVGKYGSILTLSDTAFGFGGNTEASMVYIRRRNST